jgi:predicted solute-binding protein
MFEQRKSPRRKKKPNQGKPILKMAQELVAKKCGLLKDEQQLDAMTIQQYLDVYRRQLSEQSMEAIRKLSEIAEEKKKKKKEKKNIAEEATKVVQENEGKKKNK